jgi:CBS domain-containing protein
MKISELMTRDVFTCRTHDDLASAARLMWDHDIGALPVLDEHARVVGMITDRDICMAAYTRGERIDAISVLATMSELPTTCAEDAELHEVEALMRGHQIHRVPIVDDNGRMVGIVSINDLVRTSRLHAEVSPGEVVATLAAVDAARGLAAAAFVTSA